MGYKKCLVDFRKRQRMHYGDLFTKIQRHFHYKSSLGANKQMRRRFVVQGLLNTRRIYLPHNYCHLTGRSHGVYRAWHLERNHIYRFLKKGWLLGIRCVNA
jgi:ribosomal protein S14